METNVIIGKIFKILGTYEDSVKNKNKDYLRYLNRLTPLLAGMSKEEQIPEEVFLTVKGLREMGMENDHETVKSTMFHLIGLIEGKGR